MIIQFTNRGIDSLGSELLVVGCCPEERPLRGATGLVDWRTYGMLSRIILKNLFSSHKQEHILIPGTGQLGCRWILLVGIGSALEIEADKIRRYGKLALTSAIRLKVNSCNIFYPHLLTTGTHQKQALQWLLEGISAGAVEVANDPLLESLKLFIPSLHEEQVDLSTVMISKLLAKHSLSARVAQARPSLSK